ncbi:gasdermin-A3-like [Pyrgilauda ruficollis]|uniref:gasdermin-A3-like n=1 Tax=Pyrgilauda ruficollis TaxID=221976 RepID=UPI001B85B5D0|nr:gasdermin-A3-like [Pyrgilauda ruficollis]
MISKVFSRLDHSVILCCYFKSFGLACVPSFPRHKSPWLCFKTSATARMFKKLNKCIVNQMDPCKQLDPVESITDNEHFRPLCLLIKKRKSTRIFHRAPYYQPTGFTLDDVLLPGEDGKSTESIYQESSQFTLTKVNTDEVDGFLKISFDPASVEIKGGASLSKGFSIKPQKKNVPLQSLEALRRERQINMDHSFIKQLQRTGIKLYVVTEILEASEEAVYKESTKADGGFMAKFYATLCAQGTRENNQGIVIPKGCTLAFRTIPLHIRDGEWDLDYIKGGAMSNQGHGAVEIQAYVDDGPSTGKLEEVRIEVRYSCQIFPELSPDLQLIILNTITAVMRDKNLLQELSHKVSEAFLTATIYKYRYIQDHTSCPFPSSSLFPILLTSPSPPPCLVANLLKHDLEDQMRHFHVDARLLSFPYKEEQMLTIALVELSGIQLQEDGSAVPRDEPFEAVAALFVALYALNLLSELTEYQLLLLLESLERKIVSQQLNLVANLLKHDLEDQMRHFHVDARLLSFPYKEEQMLTIALVELSGIQLQEDGSAVPRDEPFEAVAALFVALYALNLLSGSK